MLVTCKNITFSTLECPQEREWSSTNDVNVLRAVYNIMDCDRHSCFVPVCRHGHLKGQTFQSIHMIIDKTYIFEKFLDSSFG